MSKNYLKWLVKDHRIPLVFFLVLYVLLMVLMVNLRGLSFNPRDVAAAGMGLGYGLSFVIAAALPLLLLNFVHSKKSSDMYFAVPVKRSEMLVTILLFSFLVSFGYLLIGSIVMMFMAGWGTIAFVSLLKFLFVSAVTLIAVIMTNALFFLFANNTFDGLVLTAAYNVFPFVLTAAWSTFHECILNPLGFASEWPAEVLSVNYISVVSISETLNGMGGAKTGYGIPWLTLAPLAVILPLCAYGLYRQFVRRKTERAEQVSDELLAYPAVITSYLVCSLIVLCSILVSGKEPLSEMLILFVLLFIVYVVATFVYRRKVEIRPKTLAIFAGITAICYLIASLGFSSHGFSQAFRHAWEKEPSITVYYDCPAQPEDLSIPVTAYNGNEEVWVRFTADVKEANRAQYDGLINYLRENETIFVDQYYSNDPDRAVHYAEVNISTKNGFSNLPVKKYLSVKELQDLVSAGCDVFVYGWNAEEGSWECSLQEYLNKRK